MNEYNIYQSYIPIISILKMDLINNQKSMQFNWICNECFKLNYLCKIYSECSPMYMCSGCLSTIYIRWCDKWKTQKECHTFNEPKKIICELSSMTENVYENIENTLLSLKLNRDIDCLWQIKGVFKTIREQSRVYIETENETTCSVNGDNLEQKNQSFVEILTRNLFPYYNNNNNTNIINNNSNNNYTSYSEYSEEETKSEIQHKPSNQERNQLIVRIPSIKNIINSIHSSLKRTTSINSIIPYNDTNNIG